MNIRRGHIYNVDLGSVRDGNQPCLVVSNNVSNKYGPTLNVVPISGELVKNLLPTHVELPSGYGLSMYSTLLAEQIMTIDRLCVERYIGRLDNSIMSTIDDALAVSLGLEKYRAAKRDVQVLNLCRRCADDFRTGGYRLVRRADEPDKDTCDFCHNRNGFSYTVTTRRR